MENRYKVRLSWEDEKSQIGAYKVLKNAADMADKNPGYCVFDADKEGKLIYKSGEIYVKSMYFKATLKKKVDKYKKGSKITVTRDFKKNWIMEDGTIVPAKDYMDLTKQIYDTNCKYDKDTAETFVNRMGWSSKTEYLFWCSKWCQKVYFFKGKKGEWELIKTAKCGTGNIGYGDNCEQGVGFSWKIYNKQKEYRNASGGIQKWNMHYSSAGGNSIHQGSVGKPSTHGCIALSSATAKWAFETLPVNTKVIVY